MNRILIWALALACLQSTWVAAATFRIDVSPSATGLNLGSTTYTGDHGVGLATANETAQPASAASGGEFGSKIKYDDVTNALSFDFAYGSAFGFVDLESDYTAVHLHAPGPVNFPAVNTSAGVILNLAGVHTPSGARSGRVTGEVVLTAGQEVDLFDNEIYINIHSVTNAPGEIRGQLVPVSCPAADGENLTLEMSTVMDTQAFAVCETILVRTNYQVAGPNGNLTLTAGNSVILDNGASVGVDGELTIVNDSSLQ